MCSSDLDLSAVGRIVQGKRFDFVTLLVVPPVAEQVFTEPLLVGSLQEAGRNDLVRIHILKGKRDAGRCYDVEFLFHFSLSILLFYYFVSDKSSVPGYTGCLCNVTLEACVTLPTMHV